MQAAIICRWRRAQPGMERESVKLADDVDAYSARLLKEGQITDSEWIGGMTGGDGQMYIIRGDAQKLAALSVTPEFVQIKVRSSMLNEDWRMDFAVSGKSLDDTWPGWRQMVGG